MDEKMLTDDVFVADPVEERLMLGNEAVAQGAWEAGLWWPATPAPPALKLPNAWRAFRKWTASGRPMKK